MARSSATFTVMFDTLLELALVRVILKPKRDSPPAPMKALLAIVRVNCRLARFVLTVQWALLIGVKLPPET